MKITKYFIVSLFLFSCSGKAPQTIRRVPASVTSNIAEIGGQIEEANLLKEDKKSISVIIEFKRKPISIQKKLVSGLVRPSSLTLFDDYPSDYFSRLYKLEFQGNDKIREKVIEQIKDFSFIKNVERVYEVRPLSIKTNPDSDQLTNDLFFPYLWGLVNSGQRVFKDIDDIHLEELIGKKGVDIGWQGVRKELPSLVSNDVIVAVMDSGIDYEHPDLKDAIHKNMVECNNLGKPPFRPKEDKDNNGYKGDCVGWNFTGKNKEGDNRPNDDVGHGTHVAGIIASTTNNKVGIAGLSNKLKLLPIKVLAKAKRGRREKTSGTLTEKVAKGMLYSIKAGAKVINLSLGWPLILDTKYLRETFKTALKENITIVAAAGNNNNNSPIFPCAYKGVICVGSVSVNGKISNFSNYGGHVDTLAPGDNILSTYPKTKDPDFFSVKGYEIKNGTSQASPFIAGMAGVLKSIYPDISEDELKARIFLGARNINEFYFEKTKYASHGLAHLGNSINATEGAMVRPLFKGVNSLALKGSSLALPLEIKNYWGSATNVKAKVISRASHIVLEQTDFDLENMASGETKNIDLKGSVTNTKEDHNFEFSVEISVDGETSTFKHIIKLVKDIGSEKSIVSLNLEGATFDEKKLQRKGKFKFPALKTATDPMFQSKNPVYYFGNKIKEGFELTIFKNEGGAFKAQKVKPFIPKALNVLSFIMIDINYDGKLDYFVRSLAKDEEGQYLVYSFFGQDGLPLYGENSHFRFEPKSVILNLRKINFINFIPFKHEKLGTIAVPIFLEQGKIPDADQDPDPWTDKDYRKGFHFFYFEPVIKDGVASFVTRIFDNYKFLKEIKKELKLAFNDSVFLLELLPQSVNDHKNGKAQAIVAVGKNFFTTSYLIDLKPGEKIKLRKLSTKGVHFEGSTYFPITNLGGKENEFRKGISIVGQYDESRIRMSELYGDTKNMTHSAVYSQNKLTDHILGAMASYKKGKKSYSFFQTKGHLKVHIFEKGRDAVINKRPINRFSFIPGEIFTETFYPIVKGKGKTAFPALYVDTTQISRSDVYILTLNDKNQLVSPIDYNVRIPESCKSMNPVPFGTNGIFSFSILCQNPGDDLSWSLKFMEIK
jgi:subtilisin family serine protease